MKTCPKTFITKKNFRDFLWAQGTYTIVKIQDLEVKIWDGLQASREGFGANWKSLRYIWEGLRVGYNLESNPGEPSSF